jgi:hypothetical protein
MKWSTVVSFSWALCSAALCVSGTSPDEATLHWTIDDVVKAHEACGTSSEWAVDLADLVMVHTTCHGQPSKSIVVASKSIAETVATPSSADWDRAMNYSP